MLLYDDVYISVCAGSKVTTLVNMQDNGAKYGVAVLNFINFY